MRDGRDEEKHAVQENWSRRNALLDGRYLDHEFMPLIKSHHLELEAHEHVSRSRRCRVACIQEVQIVSNILFTPRSSEASAFYEFISIGFDAFTLPICSPK